MSLNKNIDYHLNQIERAVFETQGKVDLLCFGESFLQGFDSLSWTVENDSNLAINQKSETMDKLKKLSKEYQVALLLGYIEKDRQSLYSSCVEIDDGEIVGNYRRVSKGWKAYWKTDFHYKEGFAIDEVTIQRRKVQLALCGDLWDEGWE